MPLFKKAVVGYRDEAPAPTRRGPLRGFVGAPNPDIQAEGFGLLETSPFDGFRNALREILGGRFVLEGEPRPPTGRRAHPSRSVFPDAADASPACQRPGRLGRPASRQKAL